MTSLEGRIEAKVGKSVEISNKVRSEVAAVVEAADYFDGVDYRVSSDGTFIYALPDGVDVVDGKLILSF